MTFPKKYIPRAFTLAELLVSVAIASMLMLGLSVFFAGTFRQLAGSQQSVFSEQGQFAAMEIARQKLGSAQEVVELNGSGLLIKNTLSDKEQDILPFSYIGLSDDRLVFKDLIAFSGLSGNISSTQSGISHPAGIAELNSAYYVAAPLENKIYRCQPLESCTEFLAEGLNHPIDIATDGQSLFVSDSGNHRILQISDPEGTPQVSVLAEGDLRFPTGLAYYQPELGTRALFVADTYHHQVKLIDLEGTNAIRTVMGQEGNQDCDSSAFYCRPLFPTGLYADSQNHLLYVADTGNGRILEVSDPAVKAGQPAGLELGAELSSHLRLDRIEIEADFLGETYDAQRSSLIGLISDYANKTFTSATQNGILLSDFGDCQHSTTQVYLDALPAGQSLVQGDWIAAEESFSQVQSYEPAVNCTLSEGGDGEEITEQRVRIGLESPIAGLQDGDLLFFSHPLQTTLALGNAVFSQSGFQSIRMSFYDYLNPTESFHDERIILRVGNGQLGSPEDQVRILVSGLGYPTGISVTDRLNVAEFMEFQVFQFDLEGLPAGSPQALDSFLTHPLSQFDYQSDFELNHLDFSFLNQQSLVRMEAGVPNPDGSIQEYSFTGRIDD